MKFKVNRDHFKTGLQQVLNVVGSRATMPILSNVLIQTEGDCILLTTNNLDMGISCRVQAEVLAQGSITLPVRRLADIVRDLPVLEVTIEATNNQQARITSGGVLYRIAGIPVEEFPALPSFEDERSYEFSQADLEQMLKSVCYAQSTDENRYILNGVYFSFAENKLTLVATDGRRLALISKDVEVPETHAGNLILPAKTVAELMRLLGQGPDVKIAFNDRQVSFEIRLGEQAQAAGLTRSILLVSKIVEGSYPNYRQVIPKETEQRIKIERELFLAAVRRADKITNDKNKAVKLKISKNRLEITGQSAEGDFQEPLTIAYEGPEVQVAFNPQFLIDPLCALVKDEVFFEFKDDLSPGVFKTLESFLCVIMPLRIN